MLPTTNLFAFAIRIVFPGPQLRFIPRLIPVAALIAGGAVGVLTSQTYKVAFYEAAAQIIPVFLLTLSIELRFFEFSHLKVAWKALVKSIENGASGQQVTEQALEVNVLVLFLVVLAALVAGEIVAVLAIARHHAPSWKPSQGLVLGACFSGVAMIGYAALASKQGKPPPDDSSPVAPKDTIRPSSGEPKQTTAAENPDPHPR
jgi:hypothetical protein